MGENYNLSSPPEIDSEDEIQDAWDGNFYDTDEDKEDGSYQQIGSEHEKDESDYGGLSDLLSRCCLPHAKYAILSEKDIWQRQEEAVSTIANLLLVSPTEAGILLRFFGWSVNKVSEEWFADEKRVRESVGLFHPFPQRGDDRKLSAKELTCGICFESHSLERTKAVPICGHFFCNTCWIAYIHTAISDGPGCLTLHCADPSCGATIGEDMVLSLVSQEDRAKYTRYLLRTFVEYNRTVKWCPAPGCEYAVECAPEAGSFDIVCKCSHNFCWNCLEEAHRPVDCKTVAKWILENNNESENWILVHSKPCPSCKRPIEKDEGCMHMKCTPPCRFEFCWVCLRDWITHSEGPGAFDACNGYEADNGEGVYDEAARRATETARNSLKRYAHYYERWATNESSRAKALSDLQHIKSVQIEKLCDKQRLVLSQVSFVEEAWLQIVECRRVLKWTYAYGYYLPHNDHLKTFFEYLQGEAEAQLKRLHQCAEDDLQWLLGGGTQNCFNQFRTKLAGLTRVTHNYFENLVRAVENGLADVDRAIQ